MLLDRCAWDHKRACEQYQHSLKRRAALGLDRVKQEIERNELTLEQLPHADTVRRVFSVNGVISLEKASKSFKSSQQLVAGEKMPCGGDVIGCYELRYGHRTKGVPVEDAEPTANGKKAPPVLPEHFTEYMLYVTQWRWLQCERYIRKHGELGFWSMIHDLSCPQGFIALWGRFRQLLNQYMPPVEEACHGLFPQMAMTILVINVPRVFGPAWAVVRTMLPQHHKDRIVLITTSNTNVGVLSKYVPESCLPSHLREGRPSGPD